MIEFRAKVNNANRKASIGLRFAGKINMSQLSNLFVQHSYSCYYCTFQSTDLREMTIDHVVPMSKGGDNHIRNIVPCCLKCNKRKKARSESEYLKVLDILLDDDEFVLPDESKDNRWMKDYI